MHGIIMVLGYINVVIGHGDHIVFGIHQIIIHTTTVVDFLLFFHCLEWLPRTHMLVVDIMFEHLLEHFRWYMGDNV